MLRWPRHRPRDGLKKGEIRELITSTKFSFLIDSRDFIWLNLFLYNRYWCHIASSVTLNLYNYKVTNRSERRIQTIAFTIIYQCRIAVYRNQLKDRTKLPTDCDRSEKESWQEVWRTSDRKQWRSSGMRGARRSIWCWRRTGLSWMTRSTSRVFLTTRDWCCSSTRTSGLQWALHTREISHQSLMLFSFFRLKDICLDEIQVWDKINLYL